MKEVDLNSISIENLTDSQGQYTLRSDLKTIGELILAIVTVIQVLDVRINEDKYQQLNDKVKTLFTKIV